MSDYKPVRGLRIQKICFVYLMNYMKKYYQQYHICIKKCKYKEINL